MLEDYEKYEMNKEARRNNPCINPRCDNFVDMGNSYDLCLRCFDMLVDYLGSEHLIFDYSTKPALKQMTVKQLKNVLRKAENKKPSLKHERSVRSNSQKRWFM